MPFVLLLVSMPCDLDIFVGLPITRIVLPLYFLFLQLLDLQRQRQALCFWQLAREKETEKRKDREV